MSYPSTTDLTIDNLDSGTDSPVLARVQLLALMNAVVDMINARADLGGVASLWDSGEGSDEGGPGKIPYAQIPVIPIALGGTGATNIADALVNLGFSGLAPRISIPFLFPGIVDATNTLDPRGNRIRWTNNTTKIATLSVANIVRANFTGDTGNTVLLITGGGVTMTLTLTPSLDYVAGTPGSTIQLESGDYVDVTVQSSGGAHSDIFGFLEFILSIA